MGVAPMSPNLVASSASAGAAAAPSTAVIRVDDGPRPQRRSHEDHWVTPHVQMGVGPTALAMIALVVAVIGRAVRRRRVSRRAAH